MASTSATRAGVVGVLRPLGHVDDDAVVGVEHHAGGVAEILADLPAAVAQVLLEGDRLDGPGGVAELGAHGISPLLTFSRISFRASGENICVLGSCTVWVFCSGGAASIPVMFTQ